MILHNNFVKSAQTFFLSTFFAVLCILFTPFFGATLVHAMPPGFSGGDGSGGNPYQISNCSQFELINSHLSASFVLLNSIDCRNDQNSVMIYNRHSLFTGTFDGGGNTITFTLSDPSGTYDPIGLFQKTDGAYIHDLNISGTIDSMYDTGALIGNAFSSEIDNVHSDVAITVEDNAGSESEIGGLVGYMSNTLISGSSADNSITINNSNFTGSVDGLGGLVGYIDGDSAISTSYTTGSIAMNGSDILDGIGGFVGYMNSLSTISQSYSNASVNGLENIGGFIGFLDGGTIEDSYATGNVVAENVAGGFAGQADLNAQINTSYSTGSVTGDTTGFDGGSFIGTASGITIADSFTTSQTSNFQSNESGFVGYDGSNTFIDDIFDQAGTSQFNCTSNGNPTGCNFVDTGNPSYINYFRNNISNAPMNTWSFSGGGQVWDQFGQSYPTLHALSSDDPTVYFDNGDGSSGNPYQISTCNEFKNINQYLSANFVLTQDLYCGSDSSNIIVATNWEIPFTGNFDGQGHSIDLGINDSAGNYQDVGLFDYVSNATISNLNITGSVEALYDTGTLASSVVNSTIDNVHSSASVTVDNNGDWEPNIGGLVAYMSGTDITNSSAGGNLSSSDSTEGFGGLVGGMINSTISTSYATGNLTMNGTDIDCGMGGLVGCEDSGSDISESYSSGIVTNNVDRFAPGSDVSSTGGLVGYIYNASIEDSYSTSIVSGSIYIGGFVGYMSSGTIIRTYATGSIFGNNSGGSAGGLVGAMDSSEIDESFSTSAISNFTDTYGGVLGEDDGFNSFLNDFYDANSTGQTECISGEGNITNQCDSISTSNNSYFKGDTINPPFDGWGFSGAMRIGFIAGPRVWDSYGGFFPTLHNVSSDDPDISNFFASGSGVPLDPYHIQTCTQFENINSSLTSSYVIDNDLHCEGEQNNIMIQSSGEGKNPVIDFSGTLDGGGNTIYVAIDDFDDNFQNLGLFQTTTGSTIHDLNIAGTIKAYENTGALTALASGVTITNVNSSANVTIYDNGNWEPEVGGLVGDSVGSTISGSSMTGDVTVNNDNGTGSIDTLGGMVGYVESGSSIDTSYTNGNIVMNGTDIGSVGGFAGYLDNSSQITESYATTTVTSLNSAGGFVGHTNGLIQDSYAKGNINGSSHLGGFAYFAGSNAEIDSSYAADSVTGDHGGAIAGGFVGWIQGSTINDSFSVGSVSNFSDLFGGFIGRDDSSRLSDDYYDQISSGQTICESGEKGSTSGCTGVDTTKSVDANYFIGNSTNPPLDSWDFVSTPIWDATATFLPTLHNISADDVSVPEFAGGSGVDGDPYQITTCTQFENIKNHMGANFELENSIDCSDSSYGNNITVGNGMSPFTGVFNGQNHTITIALSDPNGKFGNFGLFPLLFSAEISNLNIAGTIEAQNNTGALAGASYSSGIENVGSSVNVTIDDNNNAYLDVGGLVGYMNFGGISQSYSTGILISNGTVDGFGGLVGEEASGATITTSYATGNVTLNSSGPDCGVGGLVGCEAGSSVISQSYAKGDVVSPAAAGGLVGDNWISSIEDSYATGNVSGYNSIGGLAGNTFGNITRSYSTGSVTSTNSGLYGGGLAGVAQNNTFDDSFAVGTVSGFSDLYGGFVGYDAGENTFNNDYFDQTTTEQSLCSIQDAPFSDCAAVNTDGSDSNHFKNNNTNPPLNSWDFTSGSPVWDIYTNSFPTLHAIVADDPSGEYSGGSGVNGDPFLISTCAEFESINNNLSSYYSLQRDLTCISQGNNIMVSSDFSGNFEGNNHTITIALDDSAGNYDNVGLFQTTATGTVISDLNVAGTITALYTTGALVGSADTSEFNNDSASTTITILDNTSAYPNVGGFIGNATNDLISGSYTKGVLVSNGSVQTLGGFVGVSTNDTSIVASYSNSSVTMNSSDIGMMGAVGGFVGVDIGSSGISQSYATGAVTSPFGAGGFAGVIAFTGIEDSYATGAVSGSGQLGGFAAWMIPSGVAHVYATGAVTGDGSGADAGGLVGGASDATIEDSFATGAVSNFTDSYAGLVGFDDGGNTYSDDYYDQRATGQSECVSGGGDFEGCLSVDTSSHPDNFYFKGNNTVPPLAVWDFTSEVPSWDMNSGFFPTLHAIAADDPSPSMLFAGGDGSEGNPFHITDCASFMNINAYLSSSFVLENNIDCSSNPIYRNNAMVGNPGAPFTGTFNGNGYSISIAISDTSGAYDTVGLFRDTNGAMIQNLTITGTIESLYDTGALIGDSTNTAVDNVNSSATITIDDNDFWDPSVGGLVGYVEGGIISNSFTTGDITINTTGTGSVEGLGGLVGYSDTGAVISTSYTTGTITNGASVDCAVGGFIGCEQGSSIISQSYSTRTINTMQDAGGFAGYIGGSVVEDSYSTGPVNGLNDLGGFVGWISGGDIERSYSSSSVSSYGPSSNGAGFIDSGIRFRVRDSFAVGNVFNFDGGTGGFIAIDPNDRSTYENDYFDQATTGQGGCSSNDAVVGCTAVNLGDLDQNYFFGNTTNAPLNVWDFSGVPVWSSAPGHLPNLYAISADDPTVDGSYRFIKWEIVKKKAGTDNSCSGSSCIQAGEFIPTQDGSPVSWPEGTTATNPNGANPGNQDSSKATDGNYSTKWLDFAFAPGNTSATSGDSVLIIDTGVDNSIRFNGYKWVTGDDHTERDPVSWRLYGSNDGSTWDLLDVRNNQTITDSRTAETSVYTLHGGSFSSFGGGSGTFNDPFQITTCAQFEAINNFLSSHYILENSIDCSDSSYGNNIMVGTSTAFSGVFDGNGNTITVAINDTSGSDFDGLFAQTNDALIENLHVSGSVEAQYDTGAISGHSVVSEFDNDSSDATITIDENDTVYPAIGGLVGYINQGVISGSNFTGSVTSNGSIEGIGGLVGYVDASSEITTSYSTGNVTQNSSLINGGIGGLVGFIFNSSDVNQSYATGAVNGYGNVGGLAGFVYLSSVENSYATGPVSGSNGLGGLVGWLKQGTINTSYASGSITSDGGQGGGGLVGTLDTNSTISNSFATGLISIFSSYVGGLVGYINPDDTSNSFTNDYFDQTTTGTANCATDGALDGCSAVNTDGTDASHFLGNSSNSPFDQWDFSSAPIWDETATFLPTLHAISADDHRGVSFDGGDGSEGNPYQISTCDQLQAMSQHLSSDFILDQDVDCSGSATWNPDSSEWVDGVVGVTLIPDDYATTTHTNIVVTNNGYYGFQPVGNSDVPFTGNLNGNNKTISNLWIFRKNTSYNGIFGKAEGSTIHNLTIANSNIVGGSAGPETPPDYNNSYTGALVGHLDGGTISSVTLNNNLVRAYLSYYGGGLAGWSNNVTYSNIVNIGGVVHGSGDIIGGLVGYLNSGTLSDSSSSADVDGGWEIGGIAGEIEGDAGITNVHSSGGTVTSNRSEWVFTKTGYDAGGFAGYIGNAEIDNSYSTDNVNSSGSFAGGFAGSIGDSAISTSYASGNVTAIEETNGQGTFDPDYVGGFTGYISNSMTIDLFASGNVSSPGSHVGGFTGYIYDALLENEYATGSVSGNQYVGGFAGDIYGGYDIVQVYSTGQVTGIDTDTSGGLIGASDASGTLTPSFWNTETSQQNGSAGGTGKNTSEMKAESTYTNAGWDFGSVWNINGSVNSGYPVLQYFQPVTHITSCEDFGNINDNLSGSYILDNDITCSTMIGDDNSNQFTGGFDGGGNTITIAIDDTAGTYEEDGLFHQTAGASIANLNLTGTIEAPHDLGALIGDAGDTIIDNVTSSVIVTSTDNDDWYPSVGGLVGYAGESVITNSSVTGNVISNSSVEGLGGLVGYTDVSLIATSYATGNVTANDQNVDCGVGGFIGCENNGSDILQSYANGNVTGQGAANTGGFIGMLYNASIEDSYETGNVFGESDIGGFAGFLYGGNSMNRVYSTGSVNGDGTGSNGGGVVSAVIGSNTINDSFSTSHISAMANDAGGFIGIDVGTNNYNNDYFDVFTSGQSSCVSSGDLDGCTQVDVDGSNQNYFKNNSSNPPLDNWDFSSTPIWDTNINMFPTLHAISADDPNTVSFDGGDGSEGNPYQISTCQQIQAINNYLSSSFILEQTIDCSESGNNIMIGAGDNPFTGIFDGNGNTITVRINDSNGNFGTVGLFAQMSHASVSNLNIAGSVEAQNDTGVFAGYAEYSTFDNDSSSAILTIDENGSSEPRVGGLVGEFDVGEISNSYTTGDLVSNGSIGEIGGLVGEDDGGAVVTTSYSTSNVTVNNPDVGDVGGLVGFLHNSGDISQSYATGNVSSLGDVGGLVGGTQVATIEDSYATGNVSGQNNLGGFAGYVWYSDIERSYATGSVITDSGVNGGGFVGYATGFISGDNSYYSTFGNSFSTGVLLGYDGSSGGFAGYSDGPNTFSNDYYDQNSTGQSGCTPDGDISGCSSVTTSNSQYFKGNDTNAPMDSWNFSEDPATWDVSTAFFPTLHAISADDSVSISFAGGDGSEGNPYQIVTCSQFENINYVLSSNFVLNNDLVCTNEGNNIMVGADGNPFTGTLEGYGHTVTININDESGSYNSIGLFQNVSNAVIDDVRVLGSIRGLHTVGSLVGSAGNSSFSSDSASTTITVLDNNSAYPDVGGLIGYFYNSEISYSFTNGIVIANDSVYAMGGFIGDVENSSISTSYSGDIVRMNGSSVDVGLGGLVGFALSSEIEESYATGMVSGPSYSAGLIGGLDDSVVQNAYTSGAIFGDSYSGGMFGWVQSGTISNVYTTGSVTGHGDGEFAGGLIGYITDSSSIDNSFSTGAVSGYADVVGGVVGYDDNSTGYINDYYDQNTSGLTSCRPDGDNEGCLGIDTVGYPNPNYFKGTSLNAPLGSWDFESIWIANDGLYPILGTMMSDQVSPILTLVGAPDVVVYQNTSYHDAGATASDNSDGDITNSIEISNPVDTSTIGTYNEIYNVRDSSGNSATPISRLVTVLPVSTTQSTEATSTDMDIYIPRTVTAGTLDLSSSQTGTTTVALAHNITIHADTNTGSAVISIPSGITLTSQSDSWNGIINLPQPVDGSGVVPSSGHTASVDSSIEIGLGSTPITFDRGVRIFFAGKASKLVGWISGGSFTPITALCTDDTQNTGDSLAQGADCKMNSGSDLIVWTKHFTTYVVYDESAIVPITNNVVRTGGGGGGGGIGFAVTPLPIATATSLDFVIGDGSGITNSPQVMISMNANPTTVSGYTIAIDPSFTKSIILPYISKTMFSLPAQQGAYTVYLKYYSTTGVASAVISHTVVYNSAVSNTSVSTPVTTGASNNVILFTRNLYLGSTGSDVKALQKFLNLHGFIIAKSGVGSLGKENTSFGLATQKALKAYQKHYGITPNGSFGPATRASVNLLLAGATKVALVVAPSTVSEPKTTTSTVPSTPAITVPASKLFNMNFELNMRSPDVVRLQHFLNTNGYLIATSGRGSLGKETEIFGFGTQSALKQYQKDHNISPANGSFGPATREYINSHQ